MQTFNITVVSQPRFLAGLGLLPVALATGILAGVHIGGIPLFLLVIGLYLWCWYIYAAGRLRITISKGMLEFHWRPNAIRVHRSIEPLPINDIRSLLIDNGRNLRKIVTATQRIDLAGFNRYGGDRKRLIQELLRIAERNDIPVLGSWDMPGIRSRLSIIFYANVAVMIFTASAGLVHFSLKGFSSLQLFALAFLIQQLAFGRTLRTALQKRRAQGLD